MAKEIIRIRCPFCGMLPNLKVLEQTANEKPAEVRIIVNRFYGKKPAGQLEVDVYKKKKRGSAPGWIEYEDITDQVPEVVAKMRTFFDKRVKEYLEGEK